ncbi:pyridoxal phosphate-dependent aminotransferase [Candidatus Woesearchaeota archaeon]|nr:pyridoxal phosphate-dependent aminotransferase [Candidatus Woesearchaeota archaeon]
MELALTRRALHVQASETMAITAKADELKKKGVNVVAFTAGQPDFDTPQHIKDAAKQAMDAGFTKYTDARGIQELREGVAQLLQKRNNLHYTADDIVVSNGAKHALYNAMQVLVQEGDEVLIPVPYWVTFPEQVKFCGGKPVFVQGNGFALDIDALRASITKKTKAIIINSPNNPSGAVYPKKDLQAIADLALEHDLWVIADECYDQLWYEEQPVSIAALGEEIKEHTITVNTFSKAYSMTGWRIGYTASPPTLAERMAALQSHQTSNPCSIAQKAALAACTGKQDFISEWRKIFRERRNAMIEGLNQIKGMSCDLPHGAFYAFADISKMKQSSTAYAQELLEKKHVAVIPGKPFGMDNHIRLSYATNMEQIEEGLKRMKQ